MWDEKIVLLRRSNPLAQEIVDETKTPLDQEIPVPDALMRLLKEHVGALPPGPMQDSDLLCPATTGGMRSRSVLDKPFRHVLRDLGWTLRLTPRGMRRTFQDLARQANVHDFITRAHRASRRQSAAARGIDDREMAHLHVDHGALGFRKG